MKAKGLSVVIAGLAAITCSAADPAAKKPWEWTVDERITARTSPKMIASLTTSATEGTTSLSIGAVEAPFIIKGASNPELLLPSELYGWIIGGIDPDPSFRAGIRSMVEDELKKYGYDERIFWVSLAKANSRYTELIAQQRALAKELDTSQPIRQRTLRAQLEALGPALCAARAEAITQARRELGPRFDEFLYSAVAPMLSVGTTIPDAKTAAHLKRVEGGCR